MECWKYLKLPEVYFFRQVKSQCYVKSGYIVLDDLKVGLKVFYKLGPVNMELHILL